jgi:FMN-dependent NADH-azoreductase
MPNLLRIDASARSEGSHSRMLGDVFEDTWLARNIDGKVIRRDLARDAIPQIEETTITGFYTPPEAMTDVLQSATALSDRLIAELAAADEVLVTTPMYNFSIPAALKAWVDQIVRIDCTFSYDGTSFTALVTGKRATIAIAYGAGGYNAGGPLEALDLAMPYLKTLFGFLGFGDVRFVSIEATTGDPEALAVASDVARKSIADLAG